METKPKVVTRFAPSPTGFMHVGGVRTALYAWAFARQHGGTFILRIEDTDKEREVEGSIPHIMKSLKWLGIEWDEGVDIGGPHAPYLQSERLDSYRKYAQQLVDKGLAYADPYTKEELEAFRLKADAEKRPFLYRDHRPENPPVWDGTQALRLKTPEIKPYEWEDLVRGTLSAGPEALDDFILIKADGYPTYNFAHIIDDLEMGVTHIMRADEFISSMPKFLSLYDALEIPRPYFATLPPIMGADGKKKLGKRDGAKDILDYAKEGYLPEAMLNFLAFIGWNPGTEQELFNKEEFITAFDVAKIHKSGGRFNEEKLDWLNREYIKKLSVEEQFESIKAFLPDEAKNLSGYSDDVLRRATPTIVERVAKWSDVRTLWANGELSYLFAAPEYGREALFFKKTALTGENRLQMLAQLLKGLKTLSDAIPSERWTNTHVKDAIWAYVEENGRGEVLWPLRYALTGRDQSPDPFTVAEIIGKDETSARIAAAIKLLEA